MKQILFPTDFSSISLEAFKFALEYAKGRKSRIIVFHAFDSQAAVSEEIQKIYDKVDIQNFRNKKDSFSPFQKIWKKSNYTNISLKYIVKEGDFLPLFRDYVKKKEDKIDLVVLGTHSNKTKLFEIFMETNTIKILSEINKPVISVPEEVNFDGTFDNVLFLVDYNEDAIEPMTEVLEEVSILGATMHMVHFDVAHGDSIVPLMEELKKSLNPKDERKIKFVSVDTINIKESLEKYCKENLIDLVYIINHKRNFYQRLFSYSLAEDIIRNTNIAVMAIYKD
jgi:nucleotide-binding universal stress UspA family protein